MVERFCLELTDCLAIGADGKAELKYSIAGAKHIHELEQLLRDLGHDDKMISVARSIASHAFRSDYFTIQLGDLMGSVERGSERGGSSVSDLITLSRRNVTRVVEVMLSAVCDDELREYLAGSGERSKVCASASS